MLPRIVDALRAVIASGLERASAGPGRVALAEMAAGCARRYAEWVDVSLFADAAFVRTINAMLASADHGLRGGGCDFLAALTHTGMDHGAKVGLIARLDLVNVSRRVLNGSLNGANNSADGDDDDAEESEGKVRRWRRRSALSCLRAEASHAGAEANEPHAPPKTRATRRRGWWTSSVALCSRHESTTMAIVPLATAYVNRLKDAHALLMPASSAANAEGQLDKSMPSFKGRRFRMSPSSASISATVSLISFSYGQLE